MSQHHTIWTTADASNRAAQVRELTRRFEAFGDYFPIKAIEEVGHVTLHQDQAEWPDLIIGAGENSAPLVKQVKEASGGRTFAVMLLDPHQDHAVFDMIVLPSYEPHPALSNVLTTIGLINDFNPAYLAEVRVRYEQGAHPELKAADLPSPRYAVLVGGRYAGGNMGDTEMQHLGNMLNRMIETSGGSLMVATSPRTDASASQKLRHTLTVPNLFFYDYKNDRHIANPYEAMLDLADGIIVTGDSVRMLSESCSLGKPVRIYQPPVKFSPYLPLHSELYRGGYAKPFEGECRAQQKIPLLDEAGRISRLIAEKLVHRQ